MAPPPIFRLIKKPEDEKKKLLGSTKLSPIIIVHSVRKKKPFVPKEEKVV